MQKWYRFDEGLAQLERLEILIDSPLLKLVAPHLPQHGVRTKPALADPAALLVVGAATVIYEADRRADAELRSHWPHLRRCFDTAGYRVPTTALQARHFRDYRDKVLGGRLPDEVKEVARDLAAELAMEIGLLPEVDSPWDAPEIGQIVAADGSWWAAASKVRTVEESRSKCGIPRVVADADPHNKHSWGYNFCFLGVRGEHARQRVMLDIAHAQGQQEMEAVLPAVARLRARVGDRFRLFVYDGAMHGVHHQAVRAMGLMALNKPKGIRKRDQWRRFRTTEVGAAAAVFELGIDCGERHLFNVAAGMTWELAVQEWLGSVKFKRLRVLEVNEVRRVELDGSSKFELECTVRCKHGHHRVVIDPDATLPAITVGKLARDPTRSTKDSAKVNLSEQLRSCQVNTEEFWELYGTRNDIESGNKTMKFDFGLGTRSGSYRVGAHETDLWIHMLLANSLAWREYRQRGWHRSSPSRAA